MDDRKSLVYSEIRQMKKTFSGYVYFTREEDVSPAKQRVRGQEREKRNL